MAAKHTPIIELGNARRARELAEHACPHWDQEGGPYDGPDGPHDCCWDLLEARDRVRRARKAVARAESRQ